jgi:NAD(P)-dependent dehydrogenase (short-subunit alcohol dehydrogenase family)
VNGRAGIVTAAGNGIGRASALAFAAAGSAVLVTDVDDDSGNATVELVRAAGGEASFLHVDVSNEEHVASMVTTCIERYGRLDWAHNNAATAAAPAPITEQRRSSWERVLGVTLIGTMLCLKHELIQMQRQGVGGAIVNTASTSGLAGQIDQSPYVSAKWGVVGLTKTAALENAGFGIRVNAICPGMTSTSAVRHWATTDPAGHDAMLARIPLGSPADSADQAAAAVWLCSDAARHVTGVALPVDGGLTAG